MLRNDELSLLTALLQAKTKPKESKGLPSWSLTAINSLNCQTTDVTLWPRGIKEPSSVVRVFLAVSFWSGPSWNFQSTWDQNALLLLFRLGTLGPSAPAIQMERGNARSLFLSRKLKSGSFSLSLVGGSALSPRNLIARTRKCPKKWRDVLAFASKQKIVGPC